MKISKDVEAELKLSNLVKPEILLNGEWEWEWSDVSLGIRDNEKKEFEYFLKDSLSILPYYLQMIEKLTGVAARNKSLDRSQLGIDVFTPLLKLHHSTKGSHHANFIMEFTWDRQIFVDREEDILVPSEETGSSYYHSQLNLRWNLGQLHQS